MTLDKSRRKSPGSACPASRKRRTYWLTLAGAPIRSRSANHPLETDVNVFIAAASCTLSAADF